MKEPNAASSPVQVFGFAGKECVLYSVDNEIVYKRQGMVQNQDFHCSRNPTDRLASIISNTLALVSLALIASTAQAQIYKWLDADGKTQYSDTAPSDDKVKVEVLRITPAPQTPGKSVRSWEEQELELKKRLIQRQNAEKAEERSRMAASKENAPRLDEPRTDEQKCESARNTIKAIDEKQAYRVRARSGIRVPMDDYDRGLFENDVAKYCH